MRLQPDQGRGCPGGPVGNEEALWQHRKRREGLGEDRSNPKDRRITISNSSKIFLPKHPSDIGK